MTKNKLAFVLILPLLCSCKNNSNSELSDGAVDFANIETTESCSNKYEVIDIDNAEDLTESEFYSTYVEDIQITKISDYRPMKPISRVCLDNKNIYYDSICFTPLPKTTVVRFSHCEKALLPILDTLLGITTLFIF